MKRLCSVVRWLGIKRLIVSAVLGVVFPLLFAAWVASGPSAFTEFMILGRDEERYIAEGAVVTEIRSFVITEYGLFRDQSPMRAVLSKELVGLLTVPIAPSRDELPRELRGDAYMLWVYQYGWPARVGMRTIVGMPNRILAEENIVYVPAGWWSPVLGSEPIPLTVMPSGLALNWLSYTPVVYLLLSIPIALRHLLRRRRGLCTRCGYDLEGLDSCPECGKDRP